MTKKKNQDSDSEDNLTFSDDSDFLSDSNDEDDEQIAEKIAKLDEPLSDSDSAPEEVTFKNQKEKFSLESKQTALGIKKQKEHMKKQRTAIHNRNALQKEEKLKKLKEKRLPEDIIQSIAKVPRKEIPTESTKDIISDSANTEIDKSESDDDDLSDQEEEKTDDFISLHGSTKFKVKNIQKVKDGPSPMALAAMNFKEKALYGSKIRRESTRSYLSKLEKQKIGGKG